MVVASLAAALLVAGSAAQAAPAPAPVAARSSGEAAALAEAGRLGALIHAYDRAAWVASDALTAAIPRDRLSGLGGWVVEPAPDGSLVVTFHRGVGAGGRAIYTAGVRDGAVGPARALTGDVALTAAQRRLSDARDAAVSEASRRGWRPCTAAPFNTVTLPQADGTVLVYLLTAQTVDGAWPMGGHFRVTIGADGKPAAARPFTKSCITLGSPSGANPGERPVVLGIKHVLDPVPTGSHVFTSMTSGLPVIVGTSDGRVWQVDGARIAALPSR